LDNNIEIEKIYLIIYMNIVQAYIKFKGQLVIYISGIMGCGKTTLAKHISDDFKIKMIDQIDYYKKDYNVKYKLPDGVDVINWYTDDAIDWDKLNDDINKMKVNGLIVVGMSFPKDIVGEPDYHIHLNISKNECVTKRTEHIKSNKDKYEEEYKLIGSVTEKLKMNQLIFPYYLESTKKAKVNKFININELEDNSVYDVAFDALIELIQSYLKTVKSPETTEKESIKTESTKNIPGESDSDSDYDFQPNNILDEPEYAGFVDTSSGFTTSSEINLSTTSSDPKIKNGLVRFFTIDEDY